jgi:hypothetical protein
MKVACGTCKGTGIGHTYEKGDETFQELCPKCMGEGVVLRPDPPARPEHEPKVIVATEPVAPPRVTPIALQDVPFPELVSTPVDVKLKIDFVARAKVDEVSAVLDLPNVPSVRPLAKETPARRRWRLGRSRDRSGRSTRPR